MSETLPKGWILTTIENLGVISTGNTPPKKDSNNYGTDVPFVKPGDLDKGAFVVSTTEMLSDKGAQKARILQKNAVMITCIGNLGKVGVAGKQLATNQQINSIQFNDNIVVPKYGYYCCLTFKEWLEQQSSATTLPIINKSRFSRAPFPLPPLNEQKRIITKLDQIAPLIDEVKERLDKVPVIVKRFRQSVLTAAVTGKLTEQWRADHPDVESVGDIATKISKTIKIKNNESIIIDDEDYPNEWLPTYFVNILSELKNGVSPRPNISPPGTSILRISANRSGNVNLDDVRYLPNGNVRYSEWLLKEKDLLFTRYNGNIDLVGVCGQVKNIKGQFLYPDKLMRVRLKDEISIPGYIEIVFQSKKLRDYVISKSKSSAGQNGLSGKDLKEAVVPIPPLEEQKEIVCQADKLFALADRLESHYQKAKARVDKLSKSVLAKAFRGELVITEAELAEKEGRDFESAEKLLERIKEEKAKLVGTRKSAGGRKTTNRKETGRKKK